MSITYDDERLSEALEQNNDLRRLVADLRTELAQSQTDLTQAKELLAELALSAGNVLHGLEKLRQSL